MPALKIGGLLILAAVLAAVAMLIYGLAPRLRPGQAAVPQPVIATFEDCAAAGYPIMESDPEMCRTPDGRVFTHFVEPAESEPAEPTSGPFSPQPIDSAPEASTTSGGMTFNGCAVAGCSGQLCVSADEAAGIVTTCEYRAQYACYAEASCEKQANGECGWTQTPALAACLADPSAAQESPQAI